MKTTKPSHHKALRRNLVACLITDEEREALEEVAEQKGASVSSTIREALREALPALKKRKAPALAIEPTEEPIAA